MHDIALRLAGSDTSIDVLVTVDDHHTGADLAAAVGAHVGVSTRHLVVERTGQPVDLDRPVADLDLLAGDVVRLDGLASPNDPIPLRALALDVVSGPAAGDSAILRTGANTIGRSSGADITIADPTVSRVHATLTVGTGGTTELTPAPGAGNAVRVAGVIVAPGATRRIDLGDSIEIAGTRLVVRRFERQPCDDRDRLGQVAFHRTPYRPPRVRPADVEPVGPIPTRPEPRRLQLVAVAAPVVAGVAMYFVTGQAMFLLFTLVSPVVMIGTAVDDRRSGRRSFADDLAAFRSMVADRRAGFDGLAATEGRVRHAAHPDTAQLVRRAELRTIDLWPRGRDAPDVLRLRVGLGDDTAAFEMRLAAGGDDDLRVEAERRLRGADRLVAVPIAVDLTERHLAVHGDPLLVDGTAAALVVQVATLHSPDDVTLVGAVDPDRNLDAMKWLPHCRSVTSPLVGAHLAESASAADDLIARLLDLAERRVGETTVGHQRAVAWPRVVAVLDATLRPDPAPLARLLDLARDASISVVWLADRAADVPRQAGAVLAVSQADGARLVGRLWTTEPTEPDHDVELDHVRPTVVDRVARALAPVRDASGSSLTTSIPRTVGLFDVVGHPDVDSIAAAWRRGRGPGLPFVIGVGADGPVELDLVADGPHTLIGGTSGSGKSELLQSTVAALALRHPPERLNFLFVDYKGGASSQVFERLPHTVGYVTNLSASLAHRALVSLRAELHHRMALLEGRAKDLADLAERDPAAAPPSLVIVVDEFATLVKEVPDFVAGIVDIAQRGRSLGIHLVLATQRPTGAVDENILANTNLRISLRMLDRTESNAVLDSPDAAEIPAPLRGRGLVRLGPRRLVEFQSAYASAPAAAATERTAVTVRPFDRLDGSPSTATSTVSTSGTIGRSCASQLDVALDAIADAARSVAAAVPRRPWRDVLPEHVRLADAWDAPESSPARDEPGRTIVVGRYDAPERQAQGVALVDLERSGGLAVFGSGGSGRTTLLRTIAAGVERCGGGAVTLAFDFGTRGLAPLRSLQSVVDVATGDDLEAVTRHLLVLDAELTRRRAALASSSAEHLTAHHRDRHERFDRIVLLIDGFGAFAETLLDPLAGPVGGETWSELVHRLVVDGRTVGIHTVVTADRRSAVPTRLQSAIGSRLVLRHADPQSYADLGVPAKRIDVFDATAGRGLLDGVEIQVAVEGVDPTARGQAEALGALATESVGDRRVPVPLVSSALPERFGPSTARSIGVADVSGTAVTVDVDWSHLAIVGPSRSGRSTALAAAWHALATDDSYLVGPSSSPLAGLAVPVGRARFGRAPAVAELLDRIANRVTSVSPERPVLLFVDDVDAFDDPTLDPLWQRLLAVDEIRIVATMESRSMTGYTTSAAVNELRRARRSLVLQPTDPTEFLQATGVKLSLRPGLRMPPGRGVLLVDRQPTVLQVADVFSSLPADVAA